jgi:hypothetical protein
LYEYAAGRLLFYFTKWWATFLWNFSKVNIEIVSLTYAERSRADLVLAFRKLLKSIKIIHKNLFSINKMISQLRHPKVVIQIFSGFFILSYPLLSFFHTNLRHLTFKHNKVVSSLAILIRVKLSFSPALKVSFIFAN